MKKRHLFLFGLIMLFASLVVAQRAGLGFGEGELDETFAENGIFTFHFGADYYAYDAALQSDGKLVIVGAIEFSSGQDIFVMRLNPDGSLDPTFQGLGFTSFEVTDSDNEIGQAVELVGSKILIGGNSGFKGFLMRLNSDGSLDTDFGTNGIKVLEDLLVVNDIIMIPGISTYDIVAAGSIIYVWDTRPVLVKLSQTGTIKSSFGSGGLAIPPASVTGFFNGLYASTLGSLTACGTRRTDGSVNDDALVAKFNADGDLLTSFGGGSGYVIIDAPTAGSRNNGEAFQVDSDGKITVCGDYLAGSDSDAYAFRLNSNGTLDDSFGTSGYYASGYSGEQDEMNAIAVHPVDRKLILGGRSDYNGDFDFNISRLHTDASPDTDFGTNSWVLTDIEDSDDEIHQLLIKDNSPMGSSFLYAVGNSSLGSEHSIAVLRYLILIIDQVREANIIDFSVFPNPASNGIIQVSYQLREALQVNISLQSIDGKALYPLLQARRMAGPHEEQMALPEDYPSGTYILQVRAGEEMHCESLIIH